MPKALAVETTASASVGDVTPEPVNTTTVAANAPAAPAAAGGTSSTVIFAASIEVSPADKAPAAASPFAGLHQRLLDAFAALQKAIGKPEAASGDALKSDLAVFLQALAKRLRGDDMATAEAATRPDALLSIAA